MLYLTLLSLTSCQYHFAPHPAYWGDSFYVDTVLNKSQYPWLGPELQKALSLELVGERSLKMVSIEYADLIFSTKITKVEKNLRERDKNNQVSESQFVIYVDVKIKTPRETYKTSISSAKYRLASSTYRPVVGDHQKNLPQALADEKTASLKAVDDLVNAILVDFSQRDPSRHNPKIIKDLKKIKLVPVIKDDV